MIIFQHIALVEKCLQLLFYFFPSSCRLYADFKYTKRERSPNNNSIAVNAVFFFALYICKYKKWLCIFEFNNLSDALYHSYSKK